MQEKHLIYSKLSIFEWKKTNHIYFFAYDTQYRFNLEYKIVLLKNLMKIYILKFSIKIFFLFFF